MARMQPQQPEPPQHAPAPQDWYDHPGWYDILHAPGTAWEVRGLEKMAGRFLDQGGRAAAKQLRKGAAGRGPRPSTRQAWLEPACGTGRYLLRLSARGHQVTGLDLNPAMIAFGQAAFARKKLPGELTVGDMTRQIAGVKAGSVDVAFCLINSIRHLKTDAAMLRHFEVIARALRPAGVYAVGLSLTSYGHEFPSEDVWEGARGRTAVTQLAEYLPPDEAAGRARAERVITHLTITTPKGEHHLDSVYDLRTYSGPQWRRLLTRSPFEVIGVVDEQGRDALLLGNDQWQHEHSTGYAIYILAKK